MLLLRAFFLPFLMSIKTTVISAFAFVALIGASQAHAAGATIHFEQKSSNATYGEWILTFPNGGDYVSTLKAKILSGLEPGTYRLTVREPEKSHPSIRLIKNSTVIATSNSNSLTFDIAEGDTLRMVMEYAYTGTVEIKSSPSNVGFVMVDTLGQKFTGKTPAEFTDMPPIGYEVTYNLTTDCTVQKNQKRALIEGSTLSFYADLRCGTSRIPTAGTTAKPLGTGRVSTPAPKTVSHDTAPAQRMVQTASVSEVVPGGMMRFTVSVRNVSRQTLNNVKVTDQFSPNMIDIITPLKDGGTFAAENLMEWNIPKIYAGQTWTTTFDARAKEHVKPGDRIVLLAHGESDENASHPDAWSAVVGVGVAYMPQTGFRYDVLFALLALLGAAVATRKTLKIQ